MLPLAHHAAAQRLEARVPGERREVRMIEEGAGRRVGSARLPEYGKGGGPVARGHEGAREAEGARGLEHPPRHEGGPYVVGQIRPRCAPSIALGA